MGKVEVGGNWSYIDELDGVPLKDGERLRVQWPDGSITEETCGVENGTFKYTDMGHEGTGSDVKAYLTIQVRGIEARYYLRHGAVEVERCS
jgi:hypothetical protein